LLTRTQQRVLGRLFGQPERSFYAAELIREARTGSGAAQRELARLEESALIVSRRIGNQKHYQANAASPVFADLRNIILKTIGLVEPLRATSDIDLMIVSDGLSYGEIFAVLDRVSKVLGRTVNPTLYTAADFSHKTKTDNAFVTRVVEGPKLWVIGTSDGDTISA
jgi:hypothetical protein